MLSMFIGYLALSNLLEFSQNGAILELRLQQHITSSIKVLRGSCCLHCFTPPANSCMAEKITCGVCVTFVKVSTNIMAIPSFAVASCTFEDMISMVILVFNSGHVLKEHINR